MSNLVHTVNEVLRSVSLTAAHASSDKLALNLSIANVSGRILSLLIENNQKNTIVPGINTLIYYYTYVNACCTNVSRIWNELNVSLYNVPSLLKTLNSSFINAPVI